MQIKTIEAHDPSTFDAEVNKALQEGWELHGPPTFQSVQQEETIRSMWGNTYKTGKKVSSITYIQVLKKAATLPPR